METSHQLMSWVYQEAYSLATSPANNITKAMAMSEIVYEAIDLISHWSSTQQREAINTLCIYLDGDNIPDDDVSQDSEVACISHAMLQAILDILSGK